MTKNAATPAAAYDSTRAGPVAASRPPAPRNRPTPIAPPMAIIWTCRLPRSFR